MADVEVQSKSQVSSRIGAHDANGEGHGDEHLECAERLDAAPLGPGMTPPICSSAGMPPRPVITPDKVSLGGDKSGRASSEDGANGANAERGAEAST